MSQPTKQLRGYIEADHAWCGYCHTLIETYPYDPDEAKNQHGWRWKKKYGYVCGDCADYLGQDKLRRKHLAQGPKRQYWAMLFDSQASAAKRPCRFWGRPLTGHVLDGKHRKLDLFTYVDTCGRVSIVDVRSGLSLTTADGVTDLDAHAAICDLTKQYSVQRIQCRAASAEQLVPPIDQVNLLPRMSAAEREWQSGVEIVNWVREITLSLDRAHVPLLARFIEEFNRIHLTPHPGVRGVMIAVEEVTLTVQSRASNDSVLRFWIQHLITLVFYDASAAYDFGRLMSDFYCQINSEENQADRRVLLMLNRKRRNHGLSVLNTWKSVTLVGEPPVPYDYLARKKGLAQHGICDD